MRKELGFAMLEVLISMLVILFGVLGIAGMQMLVVNNTETARYQSVATILASSMTAEMKANFAYWGSAPATVTVPGTVPATDCVATICTAQQMALYDVYYWGTSVANTLPTGTGTISCSAASLPVICTLTMSWSEKNIALSNATGSESGVLATGTVQTHNYQTVVSIQQ